MDGENKELLAKLQELKNNDAQRMADQLDGMIASNRENIRMKCLEAALKSFEIRMNTKRLHPTNEDILDLAEEFYKFVKEK